jgi:hypothetical protein
LRSFLARPFPEYSWFSFHRLHPAHRRNGTSSYHRKLALEKQECDKVSLAIPCMFRAVAFRKFSSSTDGVKTG